MAIKSSTFGRLELSGKDAARFIRHMNEDKPNERVKLALERGREVLAMVNARRNVTDVLNDRSNLIAQHLPFYFITCTGLQGLSATQIEKKKWHNQ